MMPNDSSPTKSKRRPPMMLNNGNNRQSKWRRLLLLERLTIEPRLVDQLEASEPNTMHIYKSLFNDDLRTAYSSSDGVYKGSNVKRLLLSDYNHLKDGGQIQSLLQTGGTPTVTTMTADRRLDLVVDQADRFLASLPPDQRIAFSSRFTELAAKHIRDGVRELARKRQKDVEVQGTNTEEASTATAGPMSDNNNTEHCKEDSAGDLHQAVSATEHNGGKGDGVDETKSADGPDEKDGKRQLSDGSSSSSSPQRKQNGNKTMIVQQLQHQIQIPQQNIQQTQRSVVDEAAMVRNQSLQQATQQMEKPVQVMLQADVQTTEKAAPSTANMEQGKGDGSADGLQPNLLPQGPSVDTNTEQVGSQDGTTTTPATARDRMDNEDSGNNDNGNNSSESGSNKRSRSRSRSHSPRKRAGTDSNFNTTNSTARNQTTRIRSLRSSQGKQASDSDDQASDLGPQLAMTTLQSPGTGMSLSLEINWKTGSPSGCHLHEVDECDCGEADLKRGNIFHGQISTEPRFLESLAEDAKAGIQGIQDKRRLEEENYGNEQNKQPQLQRLPFKKVEVIDMEVLDREMKNGLRTVKVLEDRKPAPTVQKVTEHFLKLESPEWKSMMSLLQSIPSCEKCRTGDLHLTEPTGLGNLVHSFQGHTDKIDFPYVIFLPLSGEFWTLVAVPAHSPDAKEPDDGLEAMRKDLEGGVFTFTNGKKGCSASDLDTYVEGFERDAEDAMKESVSVKYYCCRPGVLLKFPASIYFHATVSGPSVNETGRLLAALVEVTGNQDKQKH